MNSMSRSSAPARYAAAIPSPVATGGLVVSRYTIPHPPDARITCFAQSSTFPSPFRATTAPQHAPSCVRRSMVKVSSQMRMFGRVRA
jgi:hypothetical protein